MGLLPKNNADRIAFFTSRTTLWNTNATAIGTSTTQVTDVTTKAAAASTALAAQLAAQNVAKAATQTLDEAMLALTNSGNIVIEQVRTKARSAGAGVYPLANLPAPATPTPVGPPGTASNFKVELQQDGSLILSWKCANPAGSIGTFYNVARKIGTGDYVAIGTVGSRKITDATIPAGTASVTYQITAGRTTASGAPAFFTVNFGVSASGEATASVEAPNTPRIAA